MSKYPALTEVIEVNEVVTIRLHDAIAVVELADRASKNTFSRRLVDGMVAAFEKIPTLAQVKVVMVHGYDNYFCCGGTQQELIELSERQYDFTEIDIYRRLLDCPLPTIAAMNGHAIGGGFTFGCFADMVVMAEEAFFTANYMNYGFTPGFGSTYVLPRVLGDIIANEMMYTGRNFRGREFKERGVSAKIVKKVDVMSTAFAIAKEITQKTRPTLEMLKANQSRAARAELDQWIEREVAMHHESFKQPEVTERIRTLFK